MLCRINIRFKQGCVETTGRQSSVFQAARILPFKKSFLTTNLLLWKASDHHSLETRLPMDMLFLHNFVQFEESFKSFKSRPYLTSHVTTIEKKTPKTEKVYRSENSNQCRQINNGGPHVQCFLSRFYEIRIILKAINTRISRPSSVAFLFQISNGNSIRRIIKKALFQSVILFSCLILSAQNDNQLINCLLIKTKID